MTMHMIVWFIWTKDDGEILRGKIDIWPFHFNSSVPTFTGRIRPWNPLAFFQIDCPILHFLRLTFECQHRRHVLRGKEGLQICSLKSDDRITRRMTLVEAISCEFQNQIEQIIRLIGGKSTHACTANKVGACRVDHILFLLRDRLDNGVRSTERNITKLMQYLHDLLLIDHHSVCFGSQSIDNLMNMRHCLTAGLAFAII